MSRRPQQQFVGYLQSEQLKLVKMQDALESLLTKINESINSLKVEELQLKSSAANEMQKKHGLSSSTTNRGPGTVVASVQSDYYGDVKPHADELNIIENEINKQEIDLDLYVGSFGGPMEEEEEDD